MESFGVIEDSCHDLTPGTVFVVVHSFTPEYPEKPFAGSIITTMASGTHTADQVVFGQIPLIVAAAKLATTMRTALSPDGAREPSQLT